MLSVSHQSQQLKFDSSQLQSREEDDCFERNKIIRKGATEGASLEEAILEGGNTMQTSEYHERGTEQEYHDACIRKYRSMLTH